MVASMGSSGASTAQHVGRNLYQVSTPAVVLDLAKVQANCSLMLNAVQRLGLKWRPHIRSHKTLELTQLQVGETNPAEVNIAVATLVEAENVLPLLQLYQERGSQVNMLFTFPIYMSCVDRLAAISRQLGPGGMTIIVDHADQLKHATSLASKSGNGNKPLVYLRMNLGNDGVGVPADSPDCVRLIDQLLLSDTVGSFLFRGVYAHTNRSYETRQNWEAIDMLDAEFRALRGVAQMIRQKRPNHPLTLSAGSTPAVTALQHPCFSDSSSSPGGEDAEVPIINLCQLFQEVQREGITVEVHAAVYPTLDLQQLATHARDSRFLRSEAIAISVLVEVCSLYPGRGPNGTTEALINAGTLALAREPCVDMGSPPGEHYGNWGIVTPWNCARQPVPGPEFPAKHGGWQVSKVTQEHGILRWVGPKEDEISLCLGQRLRVWPNHACITGAGHGCYLVVDSRFQGREDEIVDVWSRWTDL